MHWDECQKCISSSMGNALVEACQGEHITSLHFVHIKDMDYLGLEGCVGQVKNHKHIDQGLTKQG